jgi:hypothetical protein
MEDILRVAKLVPPSDPTFTLRNLGERRPRRLLTPALVWSCLLFLHSRVPDRPIITLGGYDERLLWQAWRDCSSSTSARVGHLYVPQLTEVDSTHGTRALHMARTSVSLGWTSKEDIKAALDFEIARQGQGVHWHDEGQLIPWCLAGCVFLPRFITGMELRIELEGQEIGPHQSLSLLNPSGVAKSLVDELTRWLM